MNSGYLLDTNHCSKLLFRPQSKITQHLSDIADSPVLINPIIAGELHYMAEKSERKTENREIISAFLDEILIRPLDRRTCDTFATIKVGLYMKFGPKDHKLLRNTRIHQIGFSDHDIWIAATAITYHVTLVTADTDFARIREVVPLMIENWIS